MTGPMGNSEFCFPETFNIEGRGIRKGIGIRYLTSEVPLLSREYSPRKPTVRSFYPLFPSVLRFKGI